MKHLILSAGTFLIFALYLWGTAYSSGEGSSAKIYLDNGISLYQQEKYFEAIDSFRNALEVNPFYGDAYKYMAEVYFALGEYKTSLENSLNALKYSNNDPDAMLIVANSYRDLGQYDMSVDYYNRIVENFPAYVEVYRNMAELYMKMNRFPLALSMLEKADRINKNYWKNYISFGNYYLKTGKPLDAEEYFKKALMQNPTERQVYVTLADYYRSINNYDEAISLLESGEKLFNNFYSGILLLADCYLSKANATGKGYDKAIEKYLWIRENGPQKDNHFLSGIYYKIGYSYETVDQAKAVDSYRESLNYEPGNEYIRNSFEYFALNNFRVDSPVRSELSMYHLDAAKASYRKGDNDSYFFNLKRAATLYPLSVEPREKLVEYFEQKNDFYDSYQELQSLVKVDQNYRIHDKIENYEWRITNNTLKLEKPEYYKYRGLILVMGDYFNFPRVYSDAVLYNSIYFGKFKFSSMDYRKEQGINAVLEYLRENNYSFFVTAELDKSYSYLQFKLYDKNGKMIDSLSLNYKMEEMNTSVNRFLNWVDKFLPSIWIIGEESSPGIYYLSAGSMNGINNSDTFGAFDAGHGDLKEVSVLKIMNLRDYSSDIKIVTNYKERNYESLAGKYIMKNEYFLPKYLTNLKRILGY